MRYTIPQEMDYEYLNDLIASGYEPFDWATVYDYPPDIPPPELVEAWEKTWSSHPYASPLLGNHTLFSPKRKKERNNIEALGICLLISMLAALAFFLVTRNRGNEPVQLYWTLVTVYWILNYRRSKHA